MDGKKVKKIFKYQGKMNWLKSYHKKKRDELLRRKIQTPKRD